MDKSDKKPTEAETILMALDQISQTIDVMTSVVGRLRSYVQQQETALNEQSRKFEEDTQGDHTLHGVPAPPVSAGRRPSSPTTDGRGRQPDGPGTA